MMCFPRFRSDSNADTKNPDCLVYMIDAGNPAQMLGETKGAGDDTSFGIFLNEAKKLIVLVNKM